MGLITEMTDLAERIAEEMKSDCGEINRLHDELGKLQVENAELRRQVAWIVENIPQDCNTCKYYGSINDVDGLPTCLSCSWKLGSPPADWQPDD